MDGVVNSVTPDKGCEVLYGELFHEKWDETNIENLLIVMIPTFYYNGGGGHYKML